MRTTRAVPILLVAAACGSATDPGSGSGTLFALIEITGKPDSTKIEVELKARGEPVEEANVVFTDVEQEITHTAEERSGGSYRKTLNGYVRTLEVRIVQGDDRLSARLEGPSPHVITRPPNNAIVRRSDFEVLDVRWEADGRAERAEIEVDGADPVIRSPDPSQVEIPLGALRSGDLKVKVTLESSVDLAGGTSGSRMRSRYQVDNRFTLEG